MAGLWNSDRTDLCVKLWNDGLSASQVADRLGGVSRNAVIGKIHRLGLAHTKPRSTRHATVHARRRVEPKYPAQVRRVSDRATNKGPRPGTSFRPESKLPNAPLVSASPLPPEPPKPSKLFKLVDLEDNQCRFPFGDPKSKDFGFCGCVKAAGSSYCPGHARLATNAVQPVVRHAVKETHRAPAIGVSRFASLQEFMA